MSANLFDLVRSRLPEAGKTFIETHDGRVVTYGGMVAASGRIANALARLGVRTGDRVAVQVEKSPEMVLLYLACLRVGAIFLPLNTAYTLAELDYFIGNAEPALVVATPAAAAGIAGVAEPRGARVVTLGTAGDGTLMDLAAGEDEAFATVERDEDDLAAILYTSGTTGRSKGAMLSHRNLASNALTLAECWRFTASDVLLHALPIYHTHGLFVATNIILLTGGTMLFLPKLDPDTVFRLLPRATTMMGVPTFYVRLLQDARLTREARPICACSSPAPRRCSPRRIVRGRSGPGTPSSSATA